MPNRILREGILTSDRVNAASLMTEDEVLAVRSSLPRAKAGDSLQSYKWALAVRLRAIRAKRAGTMDAGYVRRITAETGPICPVCTKNMQPWIGNRWPTVDHIVALANGGTNKNENLRIVCNRCNSMKADRGARP